MSRTRVILVVLLMILGASASYGQMQDDYRFRGKVVDQQGKPIPQVHVTFHDPSTGAGIAFTTGKDGTFDRRMIPHGVYDVVFSKDGYVTHKEHFDWSAVAPQTIEKVAQIVLESQADQARKELGKKEAKLYEDAYGALGSGDCGTARKNAEELLSMGAGSYEYAVRFIIARCEAMQGETDAAMAEYKKVLALKPDLFEARFDLAGLLERQEKHDEALKEYDLAAKANPDDAETQFQIGAILLQVKKDYEGARTHLRKALELDPNHAQATKALGFADLWAEQKDVTEGVSLLKKYLELDPKAKDAEQIREMIKSFEHPNQK